MTRQVGDRVHLRFGGCCGLNILGFKDHIPDPVTYLYEITRVHGDGSYWIQLPDNDFPTTIYERDIVGSGVIDPWRMTGLTGL
jgi:hypothetical protein